MEEVIPVQLGRLAAAGDVFCERTSNRKREAQSGAKMIYMKSNDIIRCGRRVLGVIIIIIILLSLWIIIIIIIVLSLWIIPLSLTI